MADEGRQPRRHRPSMSGLHGRPLFREDAPREMVYMVAATRPAPARRGMLLLALGCGVVLALGACRADPTVENPAGYPPIPRGRAAAPAPTPGGSVPTPAGAVGPVAGSSGIYETMSGAGSARFEPKPVVSPTPPPVATVTISRERGFE